MWSLMIDIFGHGKDLTTLQISVRAFCMFFIALLLVRFGGIRIFGKKSALDDIVSIILGAILSRGITGAASFGSVVAAGAVLVLLHRIIALLCIKNEKIQVLVKGRQVLLYRDGRFYKQNMKKCSLSEADLMESLRLTINKESLEEIESAYMENNGDISFIKKKEK
jgi:uncharacterized membrane protein YcaP (DUF421 family)